MKFSGKLASVGVFIAAFIAQSWYVDKRIRNAEQKLTEKLEASLYPNL